MQTSKNTVVKKDERPLAFLGIDPAQKRSGWALKMFDVETLEWVWAFGAINGIENLGADGRPLAELLGKFQVRAYLEYPQWRGRGTDSVRTAGNAWTRWLSKSMPASKITRICPGKWMFEMLGQRTPPGFEPCDLYLPLAQFIAGSSDFRADEAAAICLAEYRQETYVQQRIFGGVA